MPVSDNLVDLLIGRAAGKVVPPPTPPAKWKVQTSATDSEEMQAPGPRSKYTAAGAALGIDYVDAEGNATSRRIRPLDMKPSGTDWNVRAICFERNGYRTFKLSRIQGAVDLKTGEMFDDPGDIFNGVLGVTYGPIRTSLDATRVVWRQYSDAINALVFLARCDGLHHPSETDVILQFADIAAPAPGIDAEHAKTLLNVAWVDERHYSASLKKVARQGWEQLQQIARYTRKLIEADGAICEAEVRFAREVDELIWR